MSEILPDSGVNLVPRNRSNDTGFGYESVTFQNQQIEIHKTNNLAINFQALAFSESDQLDIIPALARNYLNIMNEKFEQVFMKFKLNNSELYAQIIEMVVAEIKILRGPIETIGDNQKLWQAQDEFVAFGKDVERKNKLKILYSMAFDSLAPIISDLLPNEPLSVVCR